MVTDDSLQRLDAGLTADYLRRVEIHKVAQIEWEGAQAAMAEVCLTLLTDSERGGSSTLSELPWTIVHEGFVRFWAKVGGKRRADAVAYWEVTRKLWAAAWAEREARELLERCGLPVPNSGVEDVRRLPDQKG